MDWGPGPCVTAEPEMFCRLLSREGNSDLPLWTARNKGMPPGLGTPGPGGGNGARVEKAFVKLLLN